MPINANSDNLSIEKLGDELIRSKCEKYGTQLWTLGRLTRKKQLKKCYLCGETLGIKAYIPITNLSNRMKRICHRHFDETEKSQ